MRSRRCRVQAPPDGVWTDAQILKALADRLGAGHHFTADTRAKWEGHLAERGIEIVNRTRWTLYLRDPEGNRIGLSHYPDEASA